MLIGRAKVLGELFTGVRISGVFCAHGAWLTGCGRCGGPVGSSCGLLRLAAAMPAQRALATAGAALGGFRSSRFALA